MSNDYYTHNASQARDTLARAESINQQFEAIEAGFSKVPDEQGLKRLFRLGTDTGSANAYSVAMDYAPPAYADGMGVAFVASATNTGAATINIDGLGPVQIKRLDGSALLAGDIQGGGYVELRYNASATRFEIMGTAGDVVRSANSAANAASSETNAASSAASAASSASGASTSATNAANSASSASTSETGASASASAAAASEANALSYRNQAQTHKTDAETAATSATSSAGSATTKAGEAATSATNAAASASNAATSETNSATSASNAATSETNAANSAASIPNMSIASPSDGQTLVYDGVTGNFINETPPAGVTDHGLLTGLADDDHAQYHTNARGDARYYTQTQVDTALSGKSNNGHGHTKSEVGLGNVDNTADANKPVSAAMQTALDGKSNNGHVHTKAQVGLGSVDNTSDVNKPVSNATQTALNAKANSTHAHPISGVTGLQTELDGKARVPKYSLRAAIIAAGTLGVNDGPFIRVDTTGGAFTLNLPSGADGVHYYIHDYVGNCATANLTLDANSAETINGQATLVLDQNYSGVFLIWNGSEWSALKFKDSAVTDIYTEVGASSTYATSANSQWIINPAINTNGINIRLLAYSGPTGSSRGLYVGSDTVTPTNNHYLSTVSTTLENLELAPGDGLWMEMTQSNGNYSASYDIL